MVEQRQQGSPNRRSQLQRELTLALGGEAGRDEGDVQGAAEGRQRVHRAFVVQAKDGEDAAGVLGTNWGKETRTKQMSERLFMDQSEYSSTHFYQFFPESLPRFQTESEFPLYLFIILGCFFFGGGHSCSFEKTSPHTFLPLLRHIRLKRRGTTGLEQHASIGTLRAT